MKKVEGCQVCDFHLTFFLQSKKKGKNPYLHPSFSLPHSCCPKILKKKRISPLDEDVWPWEIKKKTQKKKKLRIELLKGKPPSVADPITVQIFFESFKKFFRKNSCFCEEEFFFLVLACQIW